MQYADKGFVLQVQGFSVNDGEGIRTVIFLPGCPLRCQWCSNPETWTPKAKLAVYKHKCIGCGTCRKICPMGLFPPEDMEPSWACTACGDCVKACPQGALAILNKEMSVDEIIRKVGRDAIFFRASGGGVTFSGGEPTFQLPFLRSLVKGFHDSGIPLAMETCGYFQWQGVKDIFAKLDHVFFDIKHMDSKVHQRLTGVPNDLILRNAGRIHALRLPMTVRIPLIPEVNGTDSNLKDTAQFMRQHLPRATVELLSYHALGNEKYHALGLSEYVHEAFQTPDEAYVKQAENVFRQEGIQVVHYK